jgi:hypothetical protein
VGQLYVEPTLYSELSKAGIEVPVIWTINDQAIICPDYRKGSDWEIHFPEGDKPDLYTLHGFSGLVLTTRIQDDAEKLKATQAWKWSEGQKPFGDQINVKFDYLILHQSLLKHAFGIDKATILRALLSITDRLVLSSGAGKPIALDEDEFAEIKFIEFSTLRQVVMSDPCKFALIEILEALR